jgi:hypothetical protein
MLCYAVCEELVMVKHGMAAYFEVMPNIRGCGYCNLRMFTTSGFRLCSEGSDTSLLDPHVRDTRKYEPRVHEVGVQIKSLSRAAEGVLKGADVHDITL